MENKQYNNCLICHRIIPTSQIICCEDEELGFAKTIMDEFGNLKQVRC